MSLERARSYASYSEVLLPQEDEKGEYPPMYFNIQRTNEAIRHLMEAIIFVIDELEARKD